MRNIKILSLLIVICTAISCKKDKSVTSPSTSATPATEANFIVSTHSDSGFSDFSKKTEAFGIPIYGVTLVEDSRMLHAANIMAQYLDNDEDGTVDNQLVLDAMLAENAFLVMWKNENDLDNVNPPANSEGQDLGNDETILAWHTNGHTGQFDAALEEVLHLITHVGYSNAYPDVFSEEIGSELANAMDIARGGQFTSIPNSYPESAWYSYDDETCDYSCMVTEYMYWSLTSLLGAQENREDEISQEWELHTPELIESTDVTVNSILTNPEYKLPTVLPDGSYMN